MFYINSTWKIVDVNCQAPKIDIVMVDISSSIEAELRVPTTPAAWLSAHAVATASHKRFNTRSVHHPLHQTQLPPGKTQNFQLKDSTTHDLRCFSSKPWVRAACAHQPAKLLFGVVHGWPAEQNHMSREQVSNLVTNVDLPIQKAFIIHVFHHGYLPFEELFPCMQFFSSMKFFFLISCGRLVTSFKDPNG